MSSKTVRIRNSIGCCVSMSLVPWQDKKSQGKSDGLIVGSCDERKLKWDQNLKRKKHQRRSQTSSMHDAFAWHPLILPSVCLSVRSDCGSDQWSPVPSFLLPWLGTEIQTNLRMEFNSRNGYEIGHWTLDTERMTCLDGNDSILNGLGLEDARDSERNGTQWVPSSSFYFVTFGRMDSCSFVR